MDNSQFNILIVDDEPMCLHLTQDFLRSEGFSTACASSGAEGWDILSQENSNFSVILLDRLMLGIDGMELLNKVKSSPAHQHIPVIMMTGEAERDEVIGAVKGGVFDFIYKPVERDVLLPLVYRALNLMSL